MSVAASQVMEYVPLRRTARSCTGLESEYRPSPWGGELCSGLGRIGEEVL